MSVYETFEERATNLCDVLVGEIYDELTDKGIHAEITANRHGVTVIPVWVWEDRDEWQLLVACLQVARANVAYYLKEHTAAHYSGQNLWAHLVGRPVSDYKIEVRTGEVTNVQEGEDCGCNY